MHVLFVTIRFYDYPQRIAEELKRQGHEVTMVEVDEWPPSFRKFRVFGALERIPVLGSLFRKYRFKEQAKQAEFQLKQFRGGFDGLFVIRGTFWGRNCALQAKRLLSPKSNRVLYLWDSLSNMSNKLWRDGDFDTVLSFDYDDSSKYDFEYLRLFSSVTDVVSCEDPQYDLCFIGSGNLYRWITLFRIRKYLVKKNYKYRFCTPIGQQWKRRLLDLLIGEDSSWTLDNISLKTTIEIQSRSRFVLDLPSPNQSGATMRAIECLASNFGLMTIHPRPEHYGDPEIRKYINLTSSIDRFQLSEKPSVTLALSVREGFFLSSWVRTIADFLQRSEFHASSHN